MNFPDPPSRRRAWDDEYGHIIFRDDKTAADIFSSRTVEVRPGIITRKGSFVPAFSCEKCGHVEDPTSYSDDPNVALRRAMLSATKHQKRHDRDKQTIQEYEKALLLIYSLGDSAGNDTELIARTVLEHVGGFIFTGSIVEGRKENSE